MKLPDCYHQSVTYLISLDNINCILLFDFMLDVVSSSNANNGVLIKTLQNTPVDFAKFSWTSFL